MIVILKRFAMDDVPVKLVTSWHKAEEYCRKNHVKYATNHEQDIMGCDIGSDCMSYIAVEFNKTGTKTIKSRIFS